MPSVIRNILGGAIGIATAVGTVASTEVVGRSIGALPTSPASQTPEALAHHFQALPASALLLVATGWFIAILLGSYVAVFIARSRPRLFSLLIGGVILMAAIANFALLPHPAWFVAVGISAIVLATLLATRVTGRAANNSSKPTPFRGAT